MPTDSLSKFVQGLRRSFLRQQSAGLSDGQLLGRFIDRRDKSAFEALLCWHGPMVLGVCRRVLGNAHDADDAFQATFLVLTRRTASLSRGELVGNWLYGVAYRTALRARAGKVRRRAKEQQMQDTPHPTVEGRFQTNG
jgi:DNA-directed RNA polymerase specialized sigma24 family protein